MWSRSTVKIKVDCLLQLWFAYQKPWGTYNFNTCHVTSKMLQTGEIYSANRDRSVTVKTFNKNFRTVASSHAFKQKDIATSVKTLVSWYSANTVQTPTLFLSTCTEGTITPLCFAPIWLQVLSCDFCCSQPEPLL